MIRKSLLLLFLLLPATGRLLLAQRAVSQATALPDPASSGVGIGDLLVAPVRIILEGRERTAELVLVNTGTTPATYRISFMEMSMMPTGQLVEVAKEREGEHFASGLIRYSPRQVVLEPHVSQTVRLQVRKPAELPAGEYRSHLLFRAVPEVSPDEGETGEANDGLEIRLIPIFGLSIPVIVRHGDTSADVSVEALELTAGGDDESPRLRMRLNRSGNRSVYGNITVSFLPRGGRPVIVGITNGIAVYPPLDARSAEVVLTPPSGAKLANGRLHVSFTDAEKNGEGKVLAEAEVQLP